MLNLYTNLLLVLNFLAILYVISRSTSVRGIVNSQQEFEKKWRDKNKKLMKEVIELRKALDQSHQVLLDQLERLQQKETVGQQSIPSVSSQHLLLNDRYKDIFELKEKGLTAEQIAKELEKGYGEVAFILDLANQGHS